MTSNEILLKPLSEQKLPTWGWSIGEIDESEICGVCNGHDQMIRVEIDGKETLVNCEHCVEGLLCFDGDSDYEARNTLSESRGNNHDNCSEYSGYSRVMLRNNSPEESNFSYNVYTDWDDYQLDAACTTDEHDWRENEIQDLRSQEKRQNLLKFPFIPKALLKQSYSKIHYSKAKKTMVQNKFKKIKDSIKFTSQDIALLQVYVRES